jgi:transposase
VVDGQPERLIGDKA